MQTRQTFMQPDGKIKCKENLSVCMYVCMLLKIILYLLITCTNTCLLQMWLNFFLFLNVDKLFAGLKLQHQNMLFVIMKSYTNIRFGTLLFEINDNNFYRLVFV